MSLYLKDQIYQTYFVKNSFKRYDLNRRKFLKSTLIVGVSLAYIPSLCSCKEQKLQYSLDLNVPTKLFDGKRCWCHPRAGIVPGAGDGGGP